VKQLLLISLFLVASPLLAETDRVKEIGALTLVDGDAKVTGSFFASSGTINSFMVVGTTTADSAPLGRIGQYIESIGNTTTAASTTYGDMTSISLTPGDWDVTAVNYFNSGTAITVAITGISTTSGNSSTGLVAGSNQAVDVRADSAHDWTQVVPSYRMSLSATTTVYLKASATYTGTFTCSFRLSARRVR
jgi:hypothetical protein